MEYNSWGILFLEELYTYLSITLLVCHLTVDFHTHFRFYI